MKMISLWEKVKNAKQSEQVEIAQSMNSYMNALEKVNKEAEEILNDIYKADDIEDSDLEALEISYTRYGKALYISNVKSKDSFEKLVILLTERYGEGKKEAHWDNGVRYIFESEPNSYDNNVSVNLTVKTTITGCKLVKEIITVPETITPAHEETRTTVKCE